MEKQESCKIVNLFFIIYFYHFFSPRADVRQKMDEWAQSLAIDRGSEDQVNQLISLLRDTRSCLTELSLSSTNLNVEQINTLFHSLEMSKVVKLTLYYTHFGISNIYPLIQNHLEVCSFFTRSKKVNNQKKGIELERSRQ